MLSHALERLLAQTLGAMRHAKLPAGEICHLLSHIAISKTDFRIAEQKVLYKTGGSALRMVVESARTQT